MIFLTKSSPNYNTRNLKQTPTSAAVGVPIAIAGSVGFIMIGTGIEGVTSVTKSLPNYNARNLKQTPLIKAKIRQSLFLISYH
jgi:hypothetical protein